ncbi:hypothetical protein RHMOL_Rhmol10G0296200 [Rhododendron molle]|uniref:Uncharacterized protein n=1 Tax=Rhododendron molle TaxID=49168 RepID=A0ACC0M8L6_RHOML|nr:hypothetical protein RHMOL_Rhmol10G0296200 [Rhododendron molle]
MEVYGYPSHSLPSYSFGNLVDKAKEFFRFAVSTVIGNVFSAIFTFFFALGAMTGALIGQETESGFVRGAAVGAISGAVFSIEIDVIASLLSGRLVRERIGPAMLSAVQSQMGAVEVSFEELPNMFDTGGSKGLAGDRVEKIPKDFQLGETVRSLPHCHHMFHLPCIDEWLVRHGSCPLCRRDL